MLFAQRHWDHTGGATYRAPTGSLKTVFSKAQHPAQRADWEEATHPTERNRGSYFEDALAPLLVNKQLKLLDGDKDIIPGLSYRLKGGYTSGHQITLLNVGGGKAVFFVDLVCTVCHLPIP